MGRDRVQRAELLISAACVIDSLAMRHPLYYSTIDYCFHFAFSSSAIRSAFIKNNPATITNTRSQRRAFDFLNKPNPRAQ